MVQWALKYLNQGLSVIPLVPKGKSPLIDWKPFQTRRATETEVKEWWTKWPNANIGIVTGNVSGLGVIDLDGPEGLASAASLGLESSAVSLTGSGKHLWYRSASSLVPNSVRTHPGLDIRGEGGYVVAPPSIHESGRRYRFLTPFVSSRALPPFPESLLGKSLDTKTQNTESKEESWSRKPEGWVSKALQEMKNGNVDDTFTSICGRLRSDGYTAADALAFLQPHAERVGATPGHLDEKIENVWARYEPRERARIDVQRPQSTSELHERGGLVIHSPTNPDSLKQYEQLQVSYKSSGNELFSGYPKLDAMLQGGLKSSRLFTVAARTGVGKTNWLLGAVRTLCGQGRSVLLFSTEMPYNQIWERYLQTMPDPSEFKSHKFYVCDSFAPNLERVEEAINEIRPDVFMFDHINHVSEEQRELGAFMQGLNFLRRKYECAGVVTAQLNRSADWVDLKTGEKVTPRMSMIKGSGTIEQASSRVLLLSETRVLPEGTEIVGNLDKNDNGPKGLVHFILQSRPYKMVEL